MTSNENQSKPKGNIDIGAIREMVASGRGKEVWRSFDELAETGEFLEFLKDEFPRQASFAYELSRRDFLKVLGASLALAGLSGCVPLTGGNIYPYVNAPEDLVPGKPLYFASAIVRDGYAQGAVVKSDMGRPIKIDGNPKHPANQGASDIFMQAAILDLYDPDRAQEIKNAGIKKTWQDFTSTLAQAISAQSGSQGAGIRILTETVTSPTLNDQIHALLTQFPKAKWHSHSPVGRGAEHAGAQQAFGAVVDTQYNFDKAAVILSLDSDFLFGMPGSLRYSRDFGKHRLVTDGQTEMNRLYVAESSLTVTGSNADHRAAMAGWQVETFARAVASRLGINAGTADTSNLPGAAWLDALVGDLRGHSGSSIVIAGERQPAVVHALAHAMNQALGNVGQTVTYTDPVEPNPVDPLASLADLVKDLDAGAVELLVILDGNPVYNAPADLHFADSLRKARLIVYQGLYENETAALAHWIVPGTHPLETWSDARAFDGTASIVQPLIEPLYGGKSVHEVIAALQGQATANGYDIVRAYWQKQNLGANFEQAWQQALSDGMIANTAFPARTVTLSPSFGGAAPAAPPANALEVVFEPDPTLWDGSFANNAWLQELPKPLTKLTWDNAILVSPALAERKGLADQDMVRLNAGGHDLEAPVLIQPGLPDNSVTFTLGYGRTAGGKVLAGTGFNAYALRTSQGPWFVEGADLNKTGGSYQLATTRDHFSMEGRDIVRDATIDQFRQNPHLFPESEAEPPSLYPKDQYTGHAWGMAINLSTCIGCNACVAACQAENNIPVVGKNEVLNNREMHWIRVDRYFKNSVDAPQVLFQPVPCMHCEKAPCEVVCPVEATSHSAEGLNEMTYNRCVGTRYCSNNCPYKVRRFNFYNYVNPAASLKALRNPDVTVRPRGVMEKCTYCVQRITRARIREQIDGKPMQDGTLVTACQQACPTSAIVFGDINDPNSQVRKLKAQPQNYALLSELDTKPRTSFLARFRNPNPQIKEPA